MPAFGQFERRLRLEISANTTLLSQPGWLDYTAKFGASPGAQLQEVHSIASASHIVDTAGKPLPLLEIVPPGIDEAYAIVRCDHLIKLVLGRRKRNERGGEAAVVPISFELQRLSRVMVSVITLCRASMNRDQYASSAARSCSPNRTLGSIVTHQREQTLGQQITELFASSAVRPGIRVVLKLAGLAHSTELAAGRLTSKKEPVLVIDVGEERQRKAVAVHPQHCAS